MSRDPEDTTTRRARPAQCDSCGYGPTDLAEYETWRRHDPKYTTESGWHWLCGLCSRTWAGRAHEHQDKFDYYTLATICHVGNVLLAAIKEKP